MIRIRQQRFLAAGLTVCATAGLVALAQPSVQAASCSDTRSSSISLHSIINEYEFLTRYTMSNQVVIEPKQPLREKANTGSVTVTVLACKNPTTKKWAPLTYDISTNLRDLKLVITGEKVTPIPANGKRGFGIMVSQVTSNKVNIQPLVCVNKPAPLSFLGALKFVTGLPIPGRYTVAAALNVTNRLLPEQNGTYACGILSREQAIPWSLSPSGVAVLDMPSTGHYIFTHRATWTSPCTMDRDCGISHDQVLTVKAGM
ncbi:MAG: hypothetical protein H0U45_13160 [Tatlockia sp.]|nr:hypothetical protein [Tatlockia sp.]